MFLINFGWKTKTKSKNKKRELGHSTSGVLSPESHSHEASTDGSPEGSKHGLSSPSNHFGQKKPEHHSILWPLHSTSDPMRPSYMGWSDFRVQSQDLTSEHCQV